MKLINYDNKCIKITDIFNQVYEGNAIYNNKEYTYHEFGRNEDCLQILNYLFYKDIIKKIEILDNGFIDDYGLIEKEIVSDGIDDIIDAFDYEDDEHTCRIIKCIKNEYNLEDRDDIIKKIKDYLKNNTNDKVIKELRNL